ncbi:anthranilate phosphoribosyltransferase [Paenibacillus turpanensis]|uniref:anthranilate phosphoribosyltransferase n=1 Tax=Paenibacillus turpanensis TaxID=2689078 RepID=UPI001A9ED2B5|nr:anthranilate phosphoribosyltransferase [Paenibacillus turpanensis]
MITLLKEVARGKRGARDLTYSEARQAAEYIISGQSTAAQNGAFLVSERIKMESTDEIAAFVDALRERALRHPIAESIDCAGPYDGRSRSFISTLSTAFVLAACGVPTTLHASPSLPPKWGVTLIDVLDRLGIHAPRLSPDVFIKAAERSGVLFASAEQWCPALAQLRGIREELGLRTVFNTAEKLIRYSEAPYMAMGVFHGTVFEKTAQLMTSIGVKRAVIVQGCEGSEDLSAEKRTRCYFVENGEYELIIIDPELYQLQADEQEIEWSAEEQAKQTAAVLRMEADSNQYHMVLLNAAVRLQLVNAVSSIEEGIEAARRSLESKKAFHHFEQWMEALK